MRHHTARAGALLALAFVPAAAFASGAWTTFQRVYGYSDMIALSDTVWCATREAGLMRYDRATGQFSFIPREPGGLASNALSALAYDRGGRLWVGTIGAGVSRLTADGSRWDLVNVFDGLPGDTVNTIRAQGDTVWIATTRGIALWNGQEIAGAIPAGGAPSPFADNDITGAAVVADSLWVSTRDGIYSSPVSGNLSVWTDQTANLPNHNIDRLGTDGSATYILSGGWIYQIKPRGTWHGLTAAIGTVRRMADDFGRITAVTDLGTYFWDGSNWIQVPDAPPAAPAGDGGIEVTADPAGHYFAGSRDGLYEQTTTPPWTLRVPPGPPGNNVLNLAARGGLVYVNTYEEGIGRYDGATWRNWYPLPAPTASDTTFRQPDFAFALLIDPRGKKWFGCWAFAIEYMDDSLGTPRFIHWWNDLTPPGGWAVHSHTLAWASAADSSGRRWFGMDTDDLGTTGHEPTGLDCYAPDGTYFANFRPLNTPSMAGEKVHGLAVDHKGRLWVGYSGQGVQYANPADLSTPLVFSTVPAREKFDVTGIVAYGDSIWVRTTSELVRISAKGDTVMATLPVGAGPPTLGLHPLEVAGDGSVWVGTVDGVRIFRPAGNVDVLNVSNSPLADNEVRAVSIEPSTGVVWLGTASGVNRYDPGWRPPPPRALPALEVRVFPNPARLTGLGVALSVKGNGTAYLGEVYDLSGRRLSRFSGVASGGVFWDGRDGYGTPVKPGIYFVRFEAGGRQAVARIALVR